MASPGTVSVDADFELTGSGLALAIAKLATANFDTAGAKASPYADDALESLENICAEAQALAQAIVDEIGS